MLEPDKKYFNYAISAKYIYTIVLQNRQGDNIIGIKNKNLNLCPTEITRHNKENKLKSVKYYISEENDICNILNFNITPLCNERNTIFDKDQKHFKPLDGKNSYSLFYTYKRTPIINEHLFEQTKLSCCYINEQICIPV